MPLDKDALKSLELQFARQQEAYLAKPAGARHLAQVKGVPKQLGGRSVTPAVTQGAAALVRWLQRMPPALRTLDAAPLIRLGRLGKAEAAALVGQSIEALGIAAHALLLGGAGSPEAAKDLIETSLRFAFGADAISRQLRAPLIDPRAPAFPPIPGLDPKTLNGWIRAGALREMLGTLARCGFQAAESRGQRAVVLPIGRVDGLKPATACAGSTITVSFSGLGAQPPAGGNEVVLVIPTDTGCRHLRLSELLANWQDSGQVMVTLPSNVTSGHVGLLLAPQPQESFGCEVGSLVAAAGIWNETLGGARSRFGPSLERWASRVEAARLTPLPCANPANSAWLAAGPPRVEFFRVVEGSGPIFPRNTLTLEWSVANAEAVAIYARTSAGSENVHQVPNVPLPVAAQGRVTLAVPCSSRWEAELILEASNRHGCGGPEVRSIPLRSGYSDWLLGVGKADITDRRPGLRMAGFAYARQESHGQVYVDPATGREYPLYARAFYLREHRAAGAREQLIVSADIWTATIALKQEVLKRLNAGRSQPRFTDANLLLAGTHTHAAPGGYSEYALYNLTIGGFNPGVFETLVTGIVAAAQAAMAAPRPGRLRVATGELADCGANRSFAAFQRNPEFLTDPDRSTDREMLLLKFSADLDNRGGERPLGILNWYAIHPTSLGMFNRLISGDSKGWAAARFEAEMAATWPDFVAAFANGSAGDVSGNVSVDGQGNRTARRPLGGELPPWVLAVLPFIQDPAATQQDIDNMRRLGELQFEHAYGLYKGASFELTGRLDARHAWIDMTDFPIAAQPGARTWPPALGVSFGAGSSEDSIAYASMLMFDIDAAIPEGMDRTNFTLGGVAFWAALVTAALSAPAAAADLALMPASPVALSPARTIGMLSVVAAFVVPGARAYAATLVAQLGLKGQLPLPVQSNGTWEWNVPGPGALSAAEVAGHGEKPLLFALGNTSLAFTPTGATKADPAVACPLVPTVLPMQLLRIGGAVIAAVPAEFTTVAGLRLKRVLGTTLGANLSHVAISNYSNGYSSYVATAEEYDAQHYEGASTLYGPHTLAAYLEVFGQLARGTAVPRDTGAPLRLPVVAGR